MITKITDSIYISNRDDITDLGTLNRLGITCIYNVAMDVDDPYLFRLGVKCGLFDGEQPFSYIRTAIEILRQLLRSGHIIVVHCYMGWNRAPYIVAKYLSEVNNTSWEDEFNKITEKRPVAFRKEWMK